MGMDVTHADAKSGSMTGRVAAGLGKLHEVNLCPNIEDWDVVVLNEDDNNLHARAYKSASAKIAVVVFRGTEMTSVSNWEVDANLKTTELSLGDDGVKTLVHKGFLKAVERVLPSIQKWVQGYVFHLVGAVPSDWKLLFTGHSLGGALALLATTLAEARDWARKPDATIVFGAPRVGDAALDKWWEARGLCGKLLRVNVYNDAIHWMPFLNSWKWTEMVRDFLGCMSNKKACLKRGPAAPAVQLSDRWTHVCSSSEVLVPGAARGINLHMKDFSPMGGVLSHFISNCLYGYAYGVANSGIMEHDEHCGIDSSICPSWPEAGRTVAD